MDDDFRPKKLNPKDLPGKRWNGGSNEWLWEFRWKPCRGDRHLMPMDEHAGLQQIARVQNVYVDRYVGIFIYTHILQFMKGNTEKEQDSMQSAR